MKKNKNICIIGSVFTGGIILGYTAAKLIDKIDKTKLKNNFNKCIETIDDKATDIIAKLIGLDSFILKDLDECNDPMFIEFYDDDFEE